MTKKHFMVKFDAPAHWASALINGDCSGLSDDDQEELDAFQKARPDLGWVVGCTEETHIGRWCGLQTDMLTYTAHT